MLLLLLLCGKSDNHTNFPHAENQSKVHSCTLRLHNCSLGFNWHHNYIGMGGWEFLSFPSSQTPLMIVTNHFSKCMTKNMSCRLTYTIKIVKCVFQSLQTSAN
jgi:hypothetical protein